MKRCNGCKHAKWDRTKSGRLHPSGVGRCVYPFKMPQLPAAMYWLTIREVKPCGGYINRREDLKEHCPYFEREANVTPRVTPQAQGED